MLHSKRLSLGIKCQIWVASLGLQVTWLWVPGAQKAISELHRSVAVTWRLRVFTELACLFLKQVGAISEAELTEQAQPNATLLNYMSPKVFFFVGQLFVCLFACLSFFYFFLNNTILFLLLHKEWFHQLYNQGPRFFFLNFFSICKFFFIFYYFILVL